jgi:Amt family ammonium transporter
MLMMMMLVVLIMLMMMMVMTRRTIMTPATAGAVAERVSFIGMALYMMLFSLIIYCPLAHMTWHPDGLLRVAGVIDFAGGTVVHIAAGSAGA